jgi:D-serine deaminase-like pyridoxal phosphate-dependent protein
MTPSLVLDVDRLAANLDLMQQACDAAGVRLRPHAKGHKSPWIASRQLARGARGVAVATVSEARGLLQHGIDDVLITSGLDPAKAELAVGLSRLGRVSVVAGDVEQVRGLALAARDGRDPLPVLVDVDVGQRRGGAAGPEAAARVAEAIAGAEGLELAGVQGYEGHVQGLVDPARRREMHAAATDRLRAAVERLRADGFVVDWVTGAGTATATLALAAGLVTEIQPGSYALMDATYAEVSAMGFQQAVTVRTAVLAVLGPREVIVDAGTRAISTDSGPPSVGGRDAVWAAAGDEHGRVTGELGPVAVGDLLELVPSHADTTVPLHDAFHVAGSTSARIPVLRG